MTENNLQCKYTVSLYRMLGSFVALPDSPLRESGTIAGMLTLCTGNEQYTVFLAANPFFSVSSFFNFFH